MSSHRFITENRQPLQLGLFLPVMTGGWTMSKVARSTSWNFRYLSGLTRAAESLGFEMALAPMHWHRKGGIGGEIRYRDVCLDATATVTALAAITERIRLISTAHILYGPLHPLSLARTGATIDHISCGRWGVNIVTGNQAFEARMFGGERIAHDERFAMASEYTDILLKLWKNDENLDFEGRYWKLNQAYVSPHSQSEAPLIVTATGSPAGMDYAGRFADIVFVTSPVGADIDAAAGALPGHIAKVRQAAANHGREVKIYTNPLIFSRETRDETARAYQHVVDLADNAAIDNFYTEAAASDSQAHAGHDRFRRFVGSNIQLIGTPDEITGQLTRLSKARVDGVLLTFVDFEPDLAFFGQHILPRVKAAGLRI